MSLNRVMRAVLPPTLNMPLQLGEAAMPQIDPEQVLVKVVTTAVNRLDLLQKRGLYPVPAGASNILGVEASGTVAAVGSNVESWKVGDHVMALLDGGGYAEYVAVNQAQVMKVPASVPVDQAAAIPEAWIAAFQLLHRIARLQESESVLIHAAASGVGSATVQLARQAKAFPIIATARSLQKREFALAMGASNAMTPQDDDLAAKVLDLTGQKGVDVILDCIGGGDIFDQHLKAIAKDGRWVLFGLLGGSSFPSDSRRRGLADLLMKRATLTATTLRSRSPSYKAALCSEFSAHVIPLFESKSVSVCIDSTFDLSQVNEAHDYVQGNRNCGKVLLRVE